MDGRMRPSAMNTRLGDAYSTCMSDSNGTDQGDNMIDR